MADLKHPGNKMDPIPIPHSLEFNRGRNEKSGKILQIDIFILLFGKENIMLYRYCSDLEIIVFSTKLFKSISDQLCVRYRRFSA